MISEGIVAFSNLSQTESYNGQDTGKFSVVITMDDAEAEALKSLGVNVREYKNQPQRKFVTKFPGFAILDAEGQPVTYREIPYGSKVKIMWEAGKPHPTYGIPPYFKKIKVLELADHGDADGGVDDEDF